MRSTKRALALFAMLFVVASLAVGDVRSKLKKYSPSALLEGKPPITTALEDAVWEDPSKDGHGSKQKFKALSTLSRSENGGFLLKPGYWEMHNQSYCLKAGTHGPGGGDGYLFAPTKGPAEDAVVSIIRNSYKKPNIPQHDVQVLLWAIIARAKFEDLDPQLKFTASQLLTPKQIAMLNRSGINIVPKAVLERAKAQLPPLARQVLEAEAQLRQMVTTAGTAYADIERIAVLSGAAPWGEGSRQVPNGRWSLHPDGYYVRYLPRGYSHTVVQIWVPNGGLAVGKEYDPATHVAVPGNTSRQRLIQSARASRDS